MAKPTTGALQAIFNSNKFPATAVPPKAIPTTGVGRGTAGAGNGTGGGYATPGTPIPIPPAPSAPAASASAPAATGLPVTPPLDWQQYLTNWGFPADVTGELDRIFRTYPDANSASAAALAYIRGTQWYSDTFPGIQEGEKLGVISDEQGYRAYTNQLNDIYHRYTGGTVTGSQVANALAGGFSANHVEQQFAGTAYASAYGPEAQFDLGAFDSQGQLSASQLQSYGENQVGLSNNLGVDIDRRVQLAKQKLQGIFQGQFAGANFSANQQGRISAPSLLGGTNSSDVPA